MFLLLGAALPAALGPAVAGAALNVIGGPVAWFVTGVSLAAAGYQAYNSLSGSGQSDSGVQDSKP
jgi:hypothetical protein